jgi:WXG100 family type VII secretion target
MGQMNTDTAVLASEAANFERLSGELRTASDAVNAIASDLTAGWTGQAGGAAQAAIARYNEAATNQQKALSDISTNIQQSGLQYAHTDEDQTSLLANSMNLPH